MLGVPLEMVHGGLRVGAVYISGVLAGGYNYHAVHIDYFDVVVLDVDVDDDVDVVDNIHRFPVDEHSEARRFSLRREWRGLCSHNRFDMFFTCTHCKCTNVMFFSSGHLATLIMNHREMSYPW